MPADLSSWKHAAASPSPSRNSPIKKNISIAMCTFNGENFLPEQLASFVNQSRQPDQLVVCDDGSTDATQSILTDFRDRAPFQVDLYFNPVNLGVSRNFQQAMLKCSGDYVALSDQDDHWHHAKLKNLAELLDVNPNASFACSDAELTDEHGTPLNQRLWSKWKIDPQLLARQTLIERGPQIILRNWANGSAMMLRREGLWDFFSPIPTSWMHDHWLLVISEILNRPGYPAVEPLTYYRRHSGQTVGFGSKKWLQWKPKFAERVKRYRQKQQRLIDLELHLQNVIIPALPEAEVWIRLIQIARQDLDQRHSSSEMSWWQRGLARLIRPKNRLVATSVD